MAQQYASKKRTASFIQMDADYPQNFLDTESCGGRALITWQAGVV